MNIADFQFAARWLTRLIMVLLCQLSVLCLYVPSATCGESTTREYHVKAAYLYNFLRFTKWSDEEHSDKAVVIGILGKSPFDRRSFDSVKGKVVAGKGRKLVVEYLGPYKPGMNLRHCNLLYIGASEKNNLRSIIRALKNAPVLTVGDSPGFAQSGVMINMVIRNKKVRWEINADAVRKSGLVINSQLYNSAVRVIVGREP